MLSMSSTLILHTTLASVPLCSRHENNLKIFYIYRYIYPFDLLLCWVQHPPRGGDLHKMCSQCIFSSFYYQMDKCHTLTHTHIHNIFMSYLENMRLFTTLYRYMRYWQILLTAICTHYREGQRDLEVLTDELTGWSLSSFCLGLQLLNPPQRQTHVALCFLWGDACAGHAWNTTPAEPPEPGANFGLFQ